MSCMAGHQKEQLEREQKLLEEKVEFVIENVRVREIKPLMQFSKKLRKNAEACLKFLNEE